MPVKLSRITLLARVTPLLQVISSNTEIISSNTLATVNGISKFYLKRSSFLKKSSILRKLSDRRNKNISLFNGDEDNGLFTGDLGTGDNDVVELKKTKIKLGILSKGKC